MSKTHDEATDSDANPATGYTDVIMVEPCDTISTVDAGFTPEFLGQIDIKALLEGAVVDGDFGKAGNGGDATGIAIQYGGGGDNTEYIDNVELAGVMNMEYFFEVV